MAFSAFCLMLEAICSIDAEACSAADACSVAPCDNSWAVDASCSLPEETLSDAVAASATTRRSFSTIALT